MKKTLITIMLYGILGGLLGWGGIHVLEQPMVFLLILANVTAIDLYSHLSKD